jgi:hypothetical protein
MLLWNHAGTDPVRAAEALIKLEAREARLLGLDMPTKVAVTDPDGGIPLETIRRVMKRVDRQMVDVTPVPAVLLGLNVLTALMTYGGEVLSSGLELSVGMRDAGPATQTRTSPG